MLAQNNFLRMQEHHPVHAVLHRFRDRIWPLADLKGSEKQIHWALNIRLDKITQAQSREELNLIRNISSASFFISNRELSAKDLARKHLNLVVLA